MCGICGLEKAKLEEIRKMNQLLVHRGPDGEGIYLDNNIGLGHRRLAIIDLSRKGNQPMWSSDKCYAIVFNGEIYNFKEVKRTLKGYKFHSKTDTEVILAGYIKWGKRVLNKLNGIFAFAIYDKNKKKIFCARDRLGIKPFYYTLKPRFAFSSEFKPLLNLVDSKLNLPGFDEYMVGENTFGRNTLFENVYELLPGEWLEYSILNNSIKIKKYWKNDIKINNANTHEKWKREVYKQIKKSVEKQLVSDVPVGTYLSGGVDSSIVSAIASEKLPYTVHSFCLIFNDENINSEKKYMDSVLRKYKNIKTHFVTLDSVKYWSNFVDCTWYNEYPLVFPAQVAQYILAKEASKYVKVVLSGEGGDEVFGGYGRHLMPITSRGNYKGPFVFELYKVLQLLAVIFNKPSNYYVNQIISPEYSQKLTINYFYFYRKLILYGHKILPLIIKKHQDPKVNVSGDYLSKYLTTEIHTYLRTLLNKQDRLNMAFGVECRVPILDHEIIEKFLSIPQKYKISPTEGKIIFKEAFSSILPDDIIKRKKEGFTIPFKKYLSNINWGGSLLSGSHLARDGIFRQAGINMFINTKDEKAVYELIATEVWYRLFICKENRLQLKRLLFYEK